MQIGVAGDVLTEEQQTYVLELFENREGRFIETFHLPMHLGTLPTLTYGPQMSDSEVPRFKVYGQFWYTKTSTIGSYSSNCGYIDLVLGPGRYRRTVNLPSRQTSLVTIVTEADENQDPVVIAVYGGPALPPTNGGGTFFTDEDAALFWRDHALGYENEAQKEEYERLAHRMVRMSY